MVEHDFGWALAHLRAGRGVTRDGWNNPDVSVWLQVPDAHSKMTEPYLYMVKGQKQFPLDLSCESLLASDWSLI